MNTRNIQRNWCRRIPRDLVLLSRLFRTDDGKSVAHFLTSSEINLPLPQKIKLLLGVYNVSRHVECAHAESEILSFGRAMLALPATVAGVFVEAGCFKGGSSTKFSLFARIAGRELVIFDSFAGIPDNKEDHGIHTTSGGPAFAKGDYCGDLEEVRENVRRYGDLGVCRFVKGYFEDSMPHFREPVAAAYLDVDLASSTRTCLKYLWPLLSPGGMIFPRMDICRWYWRYLRIAISGKPNWELRLLKKLSAQGARNWSGSRNRCSRTSPWRRGKPMSTDATFPVLEPARPAYTGTTRKFIRDVFFANLPTPFQKLRTYLWLGVLARYLGPGGYGAWSLFTVSLGVTTAIASMNFGSAMMRFLSGDRTSEEVNQAVSTALSAIGICSVLVALICAALSPWGAVVVFHSPAARTLILLMTFTLPFDCLYESIKNVLRARRLNSRWAVMVLARLVPETIATILAGALLLSVNAVATSYLICASLCFHFVDLLPDSSSRDTAGEARLECAG